MTTHDRLVADELGGHSKYRARRSRKPWGLFSLSSAVAILLLLPLAFLLAQAATSGVSTVEHLIFRHLTGQLLWNTIRLTVVVTVLCAVLGTAAAWFVERTDLPGKNIWAVLVVIPIAIPDFVIAWGWSSYSTWMAGFKGAVIVMTLAVYPLVYLPVAASFRSADPSQEDVARSLGASRARTFFQITLGQSRGAILGGCLLVALVIQAEYGAFEILGFQTFTTEIFNESQGSFNVPAASALSMVLLALCLLILAGEGRTRGRQKMVRVGPMAQRVNAPRSLGKMTIPVLLGFLVLALLSLGVPIGACLYWMKEGGVGSFTGVSVAGATWRTALYSAGAAAVATAMALPVALFLIRRPSNVSRFLERSTYLTFAMPGILIALGLSYFDDRYASWLSASSPVPLICAYVVLFFPLALIGVKASVSLAPVGFEEVGRSLGCSRTRVFFKITLPLIAPGLAAAFCLVFLEAVTELTATLKLIPINAQTLATQFWQYQQNLSYGQAAPYALVIIALAAVPSYVLGRYFDRLPDRAMDT